MAEQIRVTLAYETASIEWSLTEAIAMLQSLRGDVPEGIEAVVEFEIDYGSYDDSASASFRVYYDRPITEAEIAERAAKEEARRAEAIRYQAQAERREYERLKAKFSEQVQ